MRAAEECIAYQIADVLLLMQEETGIPVPALRVDGGPTRDAFLMQFQADMVSCGVRVSAVEELSGAGAAYAAGLAMGFYRAGEIFGRPPLTEYLPHMEQARRDSYYNGWKGAVAKALTK